MPLQRRSTNVDWSWPPRQPKSPQHRQLPLALDWLEHRHRPEASLLLLLSRSGRLQHLHGPSLAPRQLLHGPSLAPQQLLHDPSLPLQQLLYGSRFPVSLQLSSHFKFSAAQEYLLPQVHPRLLHSRLLRSLVLLAYRALPASAPLVLQDHQVLLVCQARLRLVYRAHLVLLAILAMVLQVLRAHQASQVKTSVVCLAPLAHQACQVLPVLASMGSLALPALACPALQGCPDARVHPAFLDGRLCLPPCRQCLPSGTLHQHRPHPCRL